MIGNSSISAPRTPPPIECYRCGSEILIDDPTDRRLELVAEGDDVKCDDCLESAHPGGCVCIDCNHQPGDVIADNE